eukprot:COSAG06_NODE_5371_length_3518_cov_6.090130_1_plen_137_part_10
MNKLSPHGIQELMWRQRSALSCARARVSTTVEGAPAAAAGRGQQRSQKEWAERSPELMIDLTLPLLPAARSRGDSTCDDVEKPPVGLQRVERGVRGSPVARARTVQSGSGATTARVAATVPRERHRIMGCCFGKDAP